MQATLETTTVKPTSNAMLWIGRILSGLAVLFMLFDSIIKIINIQPVIDSSIELGLPLDLALRIGILSFVCIVLYLIPRTSALGAVLLTGYLGGAMSIQARVDAPLFSMIFPVILGLLLWGGLTLRDSRLRAYILQRG